MSGGLNDALPQKAIITEIIGQSANVFVPLAKYETGYIESSVYLNIDMIGKEAVVVFINGDRNQGVIVGVLP